MPPKQSSISHSRQSVLLPAKKKQKNQDRSRFCPCPVCHVSFPTYFIHEHVNLCLDGPATGHNFPSSPSSSLPSSSLLNPQKLHLISNDSGRICSNMVDEDSVSRERVESFPAEQDCTNSPLAFLNSTTTLISNGSSGENSELCVLGNSADETVRERDAKILQDGAFYSYQNTEGCHQTNRLSSESGFIQNPKAAEFLAPELWQRDHFNSHRMADSDKGIERETQNGVTYPGEDISGERSLVLQIFQVQRQSQAKLSMLCKFPMTSAMERKSTVTILQPGMVLLRSWLSLDIQQRLVNESQSAAHLFKRPTTASGGKYHLWQMAFGCSWDSKTRRYAAPERGLRFPVWMYDLGRELAFDAQKHTPVYAQGSNFEPDVALVNFYPAKDEELGVVGLGGHQDLDDYCDMPVVSVSVGDSMTFFYRRFPPQSRRKSGVQIIVDEYAAQCCKDGDTAHNSEKKIILASGDVLVFGGESRLVYHGTRCVQPGTRPPGLHMAPGRLNFTFRQCNAPMA